MNDEIATQGEAYRERGLMRVARSLRPRSTAFRSGTVNCHNYV